MVVALGTAVVFAGIPPMTIHKYSQLGSVTGMPLDSPLGSLLFCARKARKFRRNGRVLGFARVVQSAVQFAKLQLLCYFFMSLSFSFLFQQTFSVLVACARSLNA